MLVSGAVSGDVVSFLAHNTLAHADRSFGMAELCTCMKTQVHSTGMLSARARVVLASHNTSACSQQCSTCSAVHLHEDTSAQHSYANTAVSRNQTYLNLPDLGIENSRGQTLWTNSVTEATCISM